MPPLSRSARPAALAALIAFALAGCSRSPHSPTAPTGDTAPMRSAMPPATRARAMAARARADLLAIPGVAGDGLVTEADGSTSILVLLRHAGVAVPASVGGVPVRTRVSGRFHAFGLTERLRPIPIGASLGNNQECLPGTVGAILERGNKRYVLCANHILARENQGRIGEAEVQPSRVDGSLRCDPLPRRFVIGRLADFEPLRFDGTDNLMDAAIAELDVPATGATLPDAYGRPSDDPVDPRVGMRITKVGRTTGQTFATILATDVRVVLSLPLGDATYAAQFLTSEAFGDFGDSGSLAVTDDPRHRPVGMVIGGDETGAAVCTPIRPVLLRFRAHIAEK